MRARREELHLSLRGLAERSGATASSVMRLESGFIAQPRADLLKSLAIGLQLPASDLFAAAGYQVPTELPSFRPYLRAKYHDLPPEALAELDRSFADIAKKYGTSGPAAGEDE